MNFRDIGEISLGILNEYGKPKGNIIYSISRKIGPVNFTDLLNLAFPKFYFKDSSIELLGIDFCDKFIFFDEDRFQDIENKTKELFSRIKELGENIPKQVNVKLVGGISFFPDNSSELWKPFGSAFFFLPQLLLTKFEKQCYLTLNHDKSTKFDFYKYRPSGEKIYNNKFKNTEDGDIFNKWADLIGKAHSEIELKKLTKVVLARNREMISKGSIDLGKVLGQLNLTFPNCYKFLFQPYESMSFFGASPELLCRVEDEFVESIALAGTHPRGKTEYEDFKISKKFFNDPKERFEHKLVVDAIKSKLQILADTQVEESSPEIIKLSNVQHIRTKLIVKNNKISIFDLIKLLHPTPALGGLPLREALKFIKDNEPFDRGFYSSPLGWIDINLNGKFIVAIRSALKKDNKVHVFAGAGIVKQSDPKKEFQEIEFKFKTILNALEAL